jgi:hypothetical protein
MRTGLKTLHEIDAAISRARKAVGEASEIPARISDALVDVQRKQAAAYEQIAADRLGLIEAGAGGELGYVDRQAEKLLAAHADQEAQLRKKVTASVSEIEQLESKRRTQEKAVQKTVDAYDKAAADAELKILKDPIYMTQLQAVESAEAILSRASEKLELAREDEAEKGAPYRNDVFFSYLQKRGFGTSHAKGWFLTKILDRWVASLCGYQQAAENYHRLTAIPVRLERHIERLDVKAENEQLKLQTLEDEILRRDGVTAKHEASLDAQKKLEEIDAKLETAEEAHQALRQEQTRLTSGDTGPHKDAVKMLSDALQRKDLPSLRRLAAQTRTRDDDKAIEDLRGLARSARDLKDDQGEAKVLLEKYQRTLKDLEKVRRRFKSRRYDAPSSIFEREDLIGALLGQVLRGMLSGDDLWRQIQRAQRTMRRYSDNDFGGIDWTEGLRLPRQSRRRSGGIFSGSGGGWGNVGRSTRPARRRTSIPRAPRKSLPRISKRRSGGFRTGGGF